MMVRETDLKAWRILSVEGRVVVRLGIAWEQSVQSFSCFFQVLLNNKLNQSQESQSKTEQMHQPLSLVIALDK